MAASTGFIRPGYFDGEGNFVKGFLRAQDVKATSGSTLEALVASTLPAAIAAAENVTGL